MQQFGGLMLFGRELWWRWRRALLAPGPPGPLALQQRLAFLRVTSVALLTQASPGGCIRKACASAPTFEVQNPHCLSCLANQACTRQNGLKKKKKEVGLSVMIRRKGSFKSLGDDYQERWSGLNIHLLSGLGLLGLFILLPTLIELFFSFISFGT